MTQHFESARKAQQFLNALSRITHEAISLCRKREGGWRVDAHGINQGSGDALRLLLDGGHRADRITEEMVVSQREFGPPDLAGQL